MRKAVIFGSVGINRGDDLMNRVLVNACRQSGYEAVVATMLPDFIRNTYGQPSFLSRRGGLPHWPRELLDADCVIVGGGTLIQNDFGPSRLSSILLYAVTAIVLAKIVFRKPTYVLGLGINRLTPLNRRLAQAFRLADLIVVRDRASVDNARSLGLDKNLLELFDIGLCKSLYDTPPALPPGPPRPSGPYICVSLAREGHAPAALQVARTALRHAGRRGQAVVLVAMNVSPTEERSLYAQLVDDAPPGVEISIVVPETPYQVVELVRHAAACIGMRLHFCVLCLVSGVSPVVVSREQKSEWLARYVGAERLILHSDPQLATKIETALSAEAAQRLSPEIIAQLEAADHLIARTLAHILSGHAPAR